MSFRKIQIEALMNQGLTWEFFDLSKPSFPFHTIPC